MWGWGLKSLSVRENEVGGGGDKGLEKRAGIIRPCIYPKNLDRTPKSVRSHGRIQCEEYWGCTVDEITYASACMELSSGTPAQD